MPVLARALGSSASRSATRRSMSSSCSGREGASFTSWPAAFRIASTLLPSSRSAEIATIRATGVLERTTLAELLANALGAAPHLHDLGAALAHLAHGHLAADAVGVELCQHPLDRLRSGGVAEALGDEQ